MHIVITGGAGFLGQRLAQKLLSQKRSDGPELTQLTLADIVAPPAPNPDTPNQNVHLRSVVADLTDAAAARSLITADTTAVYHLAAVVSGQAEAKFDLGVAVNATGTQNLLEAVRHQAPGAKVIFASSLAVYGGDLPDVITEKTGLQPQSSYGTQKAIAELWVNDYTRKGFLDGRILRLPTVCVRPGKPNAAASSFASGIIREPLNGEPAICPVDPALPLWLSSPSAVTDNLAKALTLPAADFGPYSRTVNLPGITVTVADMIAALREVAGTEVAERIQYQPDEPISKIVASWPSQFDISRAIALGFQGDQAFTDIVRAYMRSQA